MTTPNVSWVHVLVLAAIILVAVWLLHGFAHRR